MSVNAQQVGVKQKSKHKRLKEGMNATRRCGEEVGKRNGGLEIDIKCIWKLKEKDSIINPLQVQLVTVYSSKCY